MKIKEQTIQLKRKYSLKLPDAIIASTCIVLEIPLVTADRGFIKITELNLILLEMS
ncbi:PIN domain-containing protein [Algoriphagus sp. NG3]|uniref:PIN domain-containing protein n=1 Tax=Algoriphagus sp. NG3 TaxID=3097546 RepID=UPI0039C648E7